MEKKDILVTGDRPTGNLHLGHYVGTLENRIKLQNQFDCFFLTMVLVNQQARGHLPPRDGQNLLLSF